MKMKRIEGYGVMKRICLWSICMVLFFLAVLSMGAAADGKGRLYPPNSSAIFEQARIAKHRVLFAQDFEGPVPKNYMSIWYLHPGNQCRMVFAGVSEEQSFSGKRSYKVQVEFQPHKVPKVYIRLRLQTPIWSDLKLNWRIKTETSPRAITYPEHGFSLGVAGGTDGNVAGGTGSKVSEENGWELWQASAHSDGLNVERYIPGISLYMQLGPKEGWNKFKNIKYGSDADKLQPVTIAAGTTRQFYLLVKVPDDAAAGTYKGTVTGRAKDGTVITWTLSLEVLPFDLEPTPYAYSAYYPSQLTTKDVKKKESINGYRKSFTQMEAEMQDMVEHGLNTLNLYGGTVFRTDDKQLRRPYPQPIYLAETLDAFPPLAFQPEGSTEHERGYRIYKPVCPSGRSILPEQ